MIALVGDREPRQSTRLLAAGVALAALAFLLELFERNGTRAAGLAAGGRQPARQVHFRSERVRLAQLVVAILFAGLGVFLILPSLPGTPDPPNPWGMWIGLEFPVGGADKLSTQPYVHLTLTSGGCRHDATLTGTVTLPGVQRHPADAALRIALAGATVKEGTVAARGVAPIPVAAAAAIVHDGTVLRAIKLPWTGDDPISVRLTLQGTTATAGFGACYASTPELFGPSADDDAWTRASKAEMRVDPDADAAGSVPTAAIVETSVSGYAPTGPGSTGGAVVIGHGVRVSCSARPASQHLEEPAAQALAAGTRTNCGSSQLLESPTSATTLNLRVFGAGLLLAGAVQLLLEALFAATGHRD